MGTMDETDVPGWRPLHTLPKESWRDYLLKYLNPHGHVIHAVARYDTFHEMWVAPGSDSIIKPLAYMHIPLTPDEDAGHVQQARTAFMKQTQQTD